MKTALTIFLCISLSYLGLSQQLKSGDYTMVMKSFETRTVTFSGDSPQNIYEGTIQIRENDTHKELFRFRFPKSDENIVTLTIRDQKNRVLTPFLTYNKNTKEFNYTPSNREDVVKEKALSDKDEKDIILSGMIIWFNQKK